MTTSTLFVVHRGKSNGGRSIPANVFTEESEAIAVYTGLLKEGFVDVNTGFYVTRVDSLSSEQVETVFDDAPGVVASGFAGYSAERIRSHESRIEDWEPAALTVGGDDEEFESSDSNERIVHA